MDLLCGGYHTVDIDRTTENHFCPKRVYSIQTESASGHI